MAHIPTELTGTVSIERDGKTYEGRYAIGGNWMTVSAGAASKRTRVHARGLRGYEQTLARQLLSELVREGKA